MHSDAGGLGTDMECEHILLKGYSSTSFTLRLNQARPRFAAWMPYLVLCQVAHPVTSCIPLNSAQCTQLPSQEHVVHNTPCLLGTLVEEGEAHILHTQHTQLHQGLMERSAR